MNIGIIGAGLIGEKRACSIFENGDQVLLVSDTERSRAETLAGKFKNAKAVSNNEILKNKEIDAVVVAITHNNLAKISYQALASHKHVLCEKPMGINSLEIKKCIDLSAKNKLIYKAGYNHRFHSAIWKAKEMLKKGNIGKLMHIRGVYGHGGRPGYEKEWRMNKKVSGGGELIDQAAHLIDLSLWFTDSKLKNLNYAINTSFWPVKVEDNVFLTFKTTGGIIVSLHASWTEWKNKFRYEVFGTKGYLIINGLGGSYGAETLTYGLRVPGKAPKEKIITFDNNDISWIKEWKNFVNAINYKGELIGSGKDGLRVFKIVEYIYKNK